jgi:hypothetical protein
MRDSGKVWKDFGRGDYMDVAGKRLHYGNLQQPEDGDIEFLLSRSKESVSKMKMLVYSKKAV